MNIEVYYQSRGGNTKKVANAIAEGCLVQAKEISEPRPESCDVLFLGSGVYSASLDPTMKDFIASLAGAQIGEIVLFGTSAGGKKPFGMMRKRLLALGFHVSEKTFYAHGSFLFMNKGRPNEKDLIQAKNFAQSICNRPA